MGGHTQTPFAEGSVSLGLYIADVDPTEAIAELLDQAELASAVGLDGVTLSEHHSGFDGYLPTPILGVSWMLDRMSTGWSAPCPVLLPLRPLNLLLEELAWLSSRYPERVGVGFAPGFAPADFELAGVPFEDRRAAFYARLAPAVEALRGDGRPPLGDDSAIRRTRQHPIPVVSAVAGPRGAREAARSGAGTLIATFKSPSEARSLSDEYRAAGGSGPQVLIRKCWLGSIPAERFRTVPPREQARAVPKEWVTGEAENLIHAATASELIERLADAFAESSVTALSIRLQLHASTPAETRDQIERFGADVLPGLRRAIAAAVPASSDP